MPQLDSSTFSSQIFWLLICFFSMMFIMSKFIIPRIAEVMECRQSKIDGYLNKANHFKQEAEETLQKYQEALSQATLSANQSLADTKEEMNRFISQKQSELETTLQKRIKEGEETINSEKEKALKEVRGISEKLALDVIKKIGITGIESSDIKATMKELKD